MFPKKTTLIAWIALPLSVACSDDSKPAATGGNGGADSGAGGGSNGGKGSGGKSGTGGEPGDAGPPWSMTACPGGQTATGVGKNFPPCEDVCGVSSHCLPISLVMGKGDMLADCPNDGQNSAGKCVPDQIADTLGQFVFKKCTFFLDNSEGRCVPRCIAEKQSTQASLLSRDVCGSGEVCAPCVDPTSGNTSTHACDSYCPAAPEGGLPEASVPKDSGSSVVDSGTTSRDSGEKTDAN
ncbi:MAG TPA: hypothetical protein VHE30_14885 [Polyangiaceae bacterium]|nr:hypothetical protein [Polyangiaceae bacterium]